MHMDEGRLGRGKGDAWLGFGRVRGVGFGPTEPEKKGHRTRDLQYRSNEIFCFWGWKLALLCNCGVNLFGGNGGGFDESAGAAFSFGGVGMGMHVSFPGDKFPTAAWKIGVAGWLVWR